MTTDAANKEILVRTVLLLSLFFCGVASPRVVASRPVDDLLPESTRGALVIHNAQQLRANWRKTTLSQLASDAAWRPFLEHLRRQLETRLLESGGRLGVDWGDLESLAQGQVAVAAVYRDQSRMKHATALLVEIEDPDAARQVIARIAAARGGAQKMEFEGRTLQAIRMPDIGDGLAHYAYFCLEGDYLIVSDHRGVLRDVFQRIAGQGASLAASAAYRGVMKRLNASEMPHNVQWFVDPFGFAEMATSGKQAEQTIALLKRQGFDAVQGVGGQLRIGCAEHEVQHRTYVFAPGGVAALQRAAQVLQFVNSADTAAPLPWIQEHAQTHVTLKWNLKAAFEAVKPLVNDLAGDEVFEEMLYSIANDPEGPQVDLRKDVVAHIGQRMTVVTEATPAAGEEREHLVFALEVKNTEMIHRALARGLGRDRNFQVLRVAGHDVYEYRPPAEDPNARPKHISYGRGPSRSLEPQKLDSPKRQFPNFAVAIGHGSLLVSSNLEYLEKVLKSPTRPSSLTQSADYQRMQEALERLGAGHDNFQLYTHLARSIAPTYELLRRGESPKSSSLLGLALGLTRGEQAEPRELAVDASQMPPFAQLSPYLGLSGLFIQSEDHGWLIRGCVLPPPAR